MAKKDKTDQPEKTGRRKQLGQAYRITKQADPHIGLLLLALFTVTFVVVGGLGWLLVHWLVGLIIGLPSALLVTIFVFGRRAEKAAYAQYEGQPGAAGAALGMLRRGWEVKPGISFSKNQDLVHRVVGRPGIVLIGEGHPNRVRNLLVAEKRKHVRVAGEVPVYDIVAGDGEGEVPIRKLGRHIMKLPRNLRPAEVTDVVQRLRALDAMRPQVPAPRGPMPTNPRQARAQSRQASKGR
ncbi:MAG TPA: DUF4191 domain-containing protein [Nocardioidaceae bacterium]|nr:DUF4191 domain-containing protein [Nocardioidaceae bacterium]